MEAKKGTTKSYSKGKYRYGNGGLSDLWVPAPDVSEERWDKLDWGNYPEQGETSECSG